MIGDRPARTRVEVREDIFRDNNEIAARVYGRFEARGRALVNLLGSPGAGKTTFIAELARMLARSVPSLACAVIEADLESDIDAVRLRSLGIPALQINTHGMCHIDAGQIEAVLPGLPGDATLVFVENVGNLICPSSFYLGEKKRILLASTTEGSDKPYKYPPAFESASVVIVNKMDLAGVMEFDRDYFTAGVWALNPSAPVIFVSAKTGEGMDEAVAWLRDALRI